MKYNKVMECFCYAANEAISRRTRSRSGVQMGLSIAIIAVRK